MIHRLLRYNAGWEWRVLQLSSEPAAAGQPLPSRKTGQPFKERQAAAVLPGKAREEASESEEQLLELKMSLPSCSTWVDDCRGRVTNHISVEHTEDSGVVLCGTLMIQISENEQDLLPFHFWISRTTLITLHTELRLPLRLQNEAHRAQLEACSSAPEAFFIMISVILETFHTGLDGFERRLGELESTMRWSNRTGLLDTIFERRFDLLHWSHLFIPIREVHGAAKEAFMEHLLERDAFMRMTHKLERIESLLKHYALEIDTLISMDDAISSFRGNDIMKTLTIFTVLFLPATIAGALWGVNFEWLPWKERDWGFTVMMSGIAVITLGIYIWLWRKGWTGDLLNKSRNSEAAPRSGRKRARLQDNKWSSASRLGHGTSNAGTDNSTWSFIQESSKHSAFSYGTGKQDGAVTLSKSETATGLSRSRKK